MRPELLHRPFWDVAPLPLLQNPFSRLKVPWEVFRLLEDGQEICQLATIFSELREFVAVPHDDQTATLHEQAAACLQCGWPRFAFEQPQAFPADAPLEVLGAYVGFVQAATRAGLAVRWAQPRPARLELWLVAGPDLVEVAFYFGPGDTPLRARVLETTSRKLAWVVFDLLLEMERFSVSDESGFEGA
ncbi:hypothetical protein [Hymenobacter antarcticus]|uniref:hypothetical protein n=1 Tax=Hymenobacter antarcticus TaxID=486270 RepID=UPI0031E7F9AD